MHPKAARIPTPTKTRLLAKQGASGPSAPRVSGLPTRWLWLVGALAVLTHFGALSTYFVQEDFLYLYQALHTDPTPFWAARFLSLNLWFRMIASIFGPSAVAFHVASLAVIVGIGVLVTLVMARYAGAALAVAAGALVVTSPVLFVPAHWTSANSDLLAAVLLGAALLAAAPGARAWRRLAVPAFFVLALWSKEIAVGAAPMLAWLELRNPRPSRILALFYVVFAAAIALLAPWRMGSYAVQWSAALPNLPRYVGSVVLGAAGAFTPAEETWSRLPWVGAIGWLLIGVWIVALIRRRRAEAWFASAWFLCLLAPVLPLVSQFYFYYATCAMPGLWCAALLLAAPRAPAKTPKWLVAVVVAVCVLQVAGIYARLHARLEAAPLPVDFVLRRAAIARNAVHDILPHRSELRSSVAIVSEQPVESATAGVTTTPKTDYALNPYWDVSVRVALYHGMAVKLIAPQVRDVVFVRWIDEGDSNLTIIQCDIQGNARVSSFDEYAKVSPFDPTNPARSRMERANRFIQLRMFPNAARELQEAARLLPDEPTVFLNLGALFTTMGDTASGQRMLERAIALAPHDLEARFNLGFLNWRAGARDEARRIWGPVLETAPESDLARKIRALMEERARVAR